MAKKVKQKSKKLLTKRFRVTKSGKVIRRQAFRRHLASNKSKKRLRNLKKNVSMSKPFAKKVRKRMGK